MYSYDQQLLINNTTSTQITLPAVCSWWENMKHKLVPCEYPCLFCTTANSQKTCENLNPNESSIAVHEAASTRARLVQRNAIGRGTPRSDPCEWHGHPVHAHGPHALGCTNMHARAHKQYRLTKPNLFASGRTVCACDASSGFELVTPSPPLGLARRIFSLSSEVEPPPTLSFAD